MKKLLAVLFFVFAFFPGLIAQEETLIGSGPVSHGGFGAPVVKFTQVNDMFGLLVGGRGGWIIDHSFVIGGGGYALVNNLRADRTFIIGKPFLEFGYGGVELEYILNSDKLVHYSAYVLIGGGTLTYRGSWDDHDWDDWDWNKDEFFVLEPAINVELNIAGFFRINAGGSYRFIAGLNLDNLRSSNFSGPSANITLKFGKF